MRKTKVYKLSQSADFKRYKIPKRTVRRYIFNNKTYKLLLCIKTDLTPDQERISSQEFFIFYFVMSKPLKLAVKMKFVM